MDTHHLPLVSVAIITYNQKEFLRECIESVLVQDYPNIEIVIADDCSTDGTQNMVREYEAKYPGKFVLKLSEENKGITSNSNLAHFACSGKYIAWMGGDDVMFPEKISKQIRYMEKNPSCYVCYHNLEVFETTQNKALYLLNDLIEPYEGDVITCITHGPFNGASSTMVRADKSPKNGFSELLPVASDWFYWIETLHPDGKISYINEVLGKYRKHENNVTNKKKTIGQNEIDHLNTCNLIMSINRDYFRYAIQAYGRKIYSMRNKLNYVSANIISSILLISWKPLYSLCLFVITIGRIKR